MNANESLASGAFSHEVADQGIDPVVTLQQAQAAYKQGMCPMVQATTEYT